LIANDREVRLMEERLACQNTDLRSAHMELEALYKVSSSIGQTIDLGILLEVVLETITGLDLLSVEHRGGIFIIEGNRMNLVSHLGHSEEFLDLHNNLRVGDCLCGLAAKTGEIIISGNPCNDSRHSITTPDMQPHGHIIVPLKVLKRVTGVLYLYLPPDVRVEEDRLDLLRAIGSQIGIAIENARLFEETKALTLHDPLTGLANRRLMDIVLKRNISRSKRHKRPLSVIMLDIDRFKKYNDTYGHSRGDEVLADVAGVLTKETRDIDLAVRYGGEEFLLVLSETGIMAARETAERIRRSIEEKTDVTVSLGVSAYTADSTATDIVETADRALYKAKQNGRNRVEVVD
ncbi:MAG: sensor domain-containing diguanylate cyclase, partial [Nitrospirota bacterium]|nr:sensor domain-containing diguanylate cyclase [Nitrospirota bacterium]